MKEPMWIPFFLESLREMSDVSAQRRAWIDGEKCDFPAPAELVCQVFDDSGLDDELAAGSVFSSEADSLLRQLSNAVEVVDLSGKPDRWLNGAAWTRVTDLAKQALAAISRQANRIDDASRVLKNAAMYGGMEEVRAVRCQDKGAAKERRQ